MYEVTIKFVGGIFDGIEYTDLRSYAPKVGWFCRKPIGGSPYKVVSVRKV